MKTNISSADRIIRVVIAIVIAVLYFTQIITGTLGIVLMVLATVFVLTSFLSFCPIYWSLGISSYKKKAE